MNEVWKKFIHGEEKITVKILGLEGSPRKNGNTEKLVKTILDGATEKGADTTFYKLAK